MLRSYKWSLFPQKPSMNFSSLIRATCPAHLILYELMTNNFLWGVQVINLPIIQFSLAFLLTTACTQMSSSTTGSPAAKAVLWTWERPTCQTHTKCKLTLLCILIVMLSDSKGEDKRFYVDWMAADFPQIQCALNLFRLLFWFVGVLRHRIIVCCYTNNPAFREPQQLLLTRAVL